MKNILPPDFQTRDRLNSFTHPLSCRFLEWTGWYNQTLHNRLVGHHRLYTLFQKTHHTHQDLPAPQAYILQYRSTYTPRHLITKTASLFLSPLAPIAAINHHLIHKRPDILHQFLTVAETDLDDALQQARQAILDPNFLFQPLLHNSPIGKQKGVFSKKQLLIFLDILSETHAIEHIDYDKPNKFAAIAGLLHALTGKSTTAFTEELHDNRNKSLYRFRTPGERDQLIITLTNLADTFRTAGFRSIAKQADRKIRELENAAIATTQNILSQP